MGRLGGIRGAVVPALFADLLEEVEGCAAVGAEILLMEDAADDVAGSVVEGEEALGVGVFPGGGVRERGAFAEWATGRAPSEE